MERQAAINKLEEIREVAKTYGVVTISKGDSRAIDVVLWELAYYEKRKEEPK